MPAGRKKQLSKRMDRPCRSSWTGAHEYFQAEEYDVGASPMASEPAWKTMNNWARPAETFEFPFKMMCQYINDAFIESAFVYCIGL